MTNSFLKLILRDLIKRKSFSVINILGLALGFAVCLITILYVYTEFSFDKQIPGAANKYRIILKKSNEQVAVLPFDLKDLLESQLPAGAKICIKSTNSTYTSDYIFINYKQNYYKFKNEFTADAEFLSMFGTSLIQGNTENIQKVPFQVILSEKAAHTIFGKQYSVGQVIKIGNQDYTIAGVFKDLPSTTHLNADVIFILPSQVKFNLDPTISSWGFAMFDYYIYLPEKSEIAQVEASIRKIYLNNHPDYKDVSEKERAEVTFTLEPITDIHLKSDQIKWDNSTNKGNFETVIIFGIIGILILLMALFNYINLTTAYYQTKNTFSGIQKVLGATHAQLMKYIYLQTSLLVFCGFSVSLAIINFVLPYFTVIVSRQITFTLLFNPLLLGITILLLILMILLAGLYPALKFSKENPSSLLKRKSYLQKSVLGISLREALVIIQFTISVSLISSIWVMGRQIRMMSKENLGFNPEQLIEINSVTYKKQYDLLKSRLEALPGIKAVSAAQYTPGDYINDGYPVRLSQDNSAKNSKIASTNIVEPDYFEVMHIKQLEGTVLTSAMRNKDNIILCRSAADELGLSRPLGEKVFKGNKEYTVAGVVEDVQYRSLREAPKPVIYDLGIFAGKPVIRLASKDPLKTIEDIKKIWSSMIPGEPFDFSSFDNKLESNYSKEIATLRLFNILVILSVIISAMGIWGLIKEIAVQRTKEIGVRKINGARIWEVMLMLNLDFVKWIGIAIVIATPLTWYILHKWLGNFADKSELSWWIFALSGLIALGIATVTVSWESWKAATRNPAESLRYE